MSTVSIGIAGWGDPATGKPYRVRALSPDDVGATVEPALLLSSWPTAVATELDAGTLERATGTMAFELSGLETPEGASLLAFLFTASPRPWCALLSDASVSATSLSVSRILGEDLPAAPCNLYLEREVMRCTNISDSGGGVYALTVERGCYGTQAAVHLSWDGADRFLYSRNPISDSRELTFYDLDVSASTETEWWSGLLEEPELTNFDTILHLRAQDALGLVRGARLGRDRMQWRDAIVFERQSAAGEVDLNTPNACKLKSGVVTPTFGFVIVSNGEAVLGGNLLSTSREPGALVRFSATTQGLYGTEPKPTTSTFYEALVAGDSTHPQAAWCLVRNEAGDLSGHPFDIVLNLLESTGTADHGSPTVGSGGAFDWLSRHWGLGIPGDRIDEAACIALRDSRLYRDLRCDNFIVASKEPPKASELVRRLLQPTMCFLAMTADGKLTIRSLVDDGAAAVATITDAELQSMVQGQQASAGKSYASVVLNLIRTKAGGSDFALQVTDCGLGEVEVNRYPLGREPLEVDCGDYGDPESNTIDPMVLISLRLLNRQRYMLQCGRLPPYRITLHADVPRLVAGDWVVLTCTALVGHDGVRGSVVAHRCLVLASEQSTETHTQTVVLLDCSPVHLATQRVAPSWLIESVASTTEFDVNVAKFTPDDTLTWVVDELYDLYDDEGVRISDAAAQASISGSTVTLSTPWTSGGAPVLPAAGQFVRCATYDPARAYWPGEAYFADAGGLLGANDDPPHRWGL